MARTFSPLLPPDFVGASGLPTCSTVSDGMCCAESICCMVTPARDCSLPHFSRRPSSRPYALTSRSATTGLHVCQSWPPLTLRPREPLGFPADELPPMAVGVEWPFEAVRYVAAARVACRCHRLGGLQAPLPRATDEKQFAFAIGADGIEGLDE